MTDRFPFEGVKLCPFCRRRAATRQCDAPVGRLRWIGHPPRYLSPGGVAPWLSSMSEVLTCDRLICGQCATEVAPDIDYCPLCVKRIKLRTGG